MGIKYFFKWFKDSFPKAVTKPFGEKDKQISGVLRNDTNKPLLLLLDLNGIIHTSCQKIYKYGSFEPKSLLKKSPPIYSGEKDTMVFEDVLNSINALIVSVDPQEIVLCIDGVAPISKQIQQRQRRFLAKKTSGGFDSNCISPGTDFLYKLGVYLKNNIELKLEKEWLNVSTIYFMDSLVPGEGEHKLFDFMRANRTRIARKGFGIVVVGNDADLIMLSLLVSTLFLKENAIYILREDLNSRKLDYLLVDVDQFKKSILDFAAAKPGFKHYDSELVICDFVILCFMVGNDFLPPISLFNIYDGGLDLMMKHYFTTVGYTTKKGKQKIEISFQNLAGIFDHLLNTINPQAVQHYKTREYGYPNILLDIASRKETSVMDIVLHYLKAYTIHHNINKKLIEAYLEEIRWVFNYYAYGGSTVDWKTYYPSQFAPTALDLLNYLKSANNKFVSPEEEEGGGYSKFQVDPFFQLLCILPPNSADLLPVPLNKVLTERMKSFHPKEIEMDYSGKLNEWEGIPLLPPLNYDKILAIYKSHVNKCPEAELKRNTVSKQLMMSVHQQ